MLTNLSAEQLVGLNGQSYNANMSNMAWEVTAGISVIILALVLLPRYIGGAFTTLPEFVNSRFDEGTRMMVTLLFMLGYTFVTIPSVLYSGAIVVHVVLYYMLIWGFPMFFGFSFDIIFIHIQGILFVLAVLIMMISGFIRPLDAPHQFTHDPKVDMVPWTFAVPVTMLLIGAMVFCYGSFPTEAGTGNTVPCLRKCTKKRSYSNAIASFASIPS
ncbi:sodium:solute symporter family transporter [Salinicoccus roseus]|uniref:sodium:solute symporter family transporter n=2 Tax=Salinicoccus roseus TaxID=45670 RepID=UPI0037422961